MRSGVTLSTLVSEVLIEAGMSVESGHSTQMAPRIKQLLARTQRLLLREFDWPTISGYEVTVNIDGATTPGLSTGTLPTGIDFTAINSVHVLFGDQWLPVQYGIGPRERSIYSSTQRATPIQRWEIVASAPTTFEIWPTADVLQTLRFQGSKALGAFASDSDTCTLDGDVLVLRVAAELLGRDRKEDAALKMKSAKDLANSIIKRQRQARTEPIPQGRVRTLYPRPGIDFIPPSG